MQLLPGLVIGGDLGSALGALDVEADDLAAVPAWRAALLGIAVLDVAEVGEPDEAAARKRDLRLRKSIGVGGVAEDAHRLLRAGDFGAAAGGVDIALSELLVDLRRGDALRLKRRGVEHHADGAVDAAARAILRRRPEPEQPLGDRIVDVPAELLEAHVGGLRADGQDRVAGDVDALDLRLEDASAGCRGSGRWRCGRR